MWVDVLGMLYYATLASNECWFGLHMSVDDGVLAWQLMRLTSSSGLSYEVRQPYLHPMQRHRECFV